MKFLMILLGATLLGLCLTERRRYDGYQVWQISPERGHYPLIQNLEEQGLIDVMGNEILVAPESIPQVHVIFTENNIPFQVQNTNIQIDLDETWKRIDSRKAYDPNDFNTYEDIISEINRMAVEDCPSGFDCNTYSIGESIEGRDIRVISVTQGSGRPGLWFESLIHCREWLAGTTLMRVLDQFLTGYGTDSDASYVLDTYDLYILPVVNPDGYVYTFTTERMWRKNRRINSGSSCMGVDLNRNYDYDWGGIGASDNPCSDLYAGSAVHSEPETVAVTTEVTRLSDDLMAFTDVHTVMPAWLIPYSDCTYPPNFDDIERVAHAVVDAIESTHNTNWDVGNTCEVLYYVSGATDDWARSIGIPYSATPELRGPGFNPPVSAIQPSFEEVYNGFVTMAREIEAIGKEKKETL